MPTGTAPDRDEILRLARTWDKARRGEIDREALRTARVRLGVYSARGGNDRYTLRIKLPLGLLTADQLDAVADVALRFGDSHPMHVTTRQGLEVYGVSGSDIAPVLLRLAAAGLTTRGAGGNVVRNVVACPWAGVAPDEVFDVTPHALGVARYFFRHPDFQNLPRKVKMAFEGCPVDHVGTAVNDLGAVAAVEGDRGSARRGFRLTVGGGLGAAPRVGDLIEPFTPEEALLPTCEAVLRVYDRLGERGNRSRARLKYLVRDLGIDAFRRHVFAEREAILAAAASGAWDAMTAPMNEGTENEGTEVESPCVVPVVAPQTEAYRQWAARSIMPQRQEGFVAVRVYCPFGDLAPAQARVLADVARRFSRGGLRATPDQNVLLRWVPAPLVPAVHARLEEAGLARCCAGRIADITRCAGATTCVSAITDCRGLAEAIVRSLPASLTRHPAVGPLRIGVSGCPHACGRHWICDIGLYGTARRVHDRMAPFYQMVIGGETSGDTARLAAPLAEVPARRVPEAVRRLLTLFESARGKDEGWREFLDRMGIDALQWLMKDLGSTHPPDWAPDLYHDCGSDQEFRVEARGGECAV